MIEDYIKRDVVIRCELDLALTEKLIHYFILMNDCRENADRLSQITVAKTLKDFHRLLSRRRFIERIIIRFLKRRETE
jgi:hypothetical protein